ncbi:MAG: GNAT family N-acetyltransferase [Pseudomonadota bacterium]
MSEVEIRIVDPSADDIVALLEEHMADMVVTSPPESRHALDLEGLCAPDVTFWAGRIRGDLAVIGALKALDPAHGEIKSMRTSTHFKRMGLAQNMLDHILHSAKQDGMARVSLETGSMEYFEPARRLYERSGFEYCPPFGSYVLDPYSVFMTKSL